MMLRKELIELGLTKYEAEAYICILKRGISEAGSIHKETNIPYGKIYETLNNLVSKGLLEVQNTRPKKYMARNPKVALNDYYSNIKIKIENELESTRKLITNIGEEIDNIIIQKTPEKSFWKTAMDEEIYQMIISNFEEAEKEICILLYPPRKFNERTNFHSEEKNEFTFTQNEMEKTLSRGIKLKIISSKELGMMHILQNNATQTEKNMMKNFEIRFTDKPFPAYFTIIDDDKVVFSIIDPIEQNNIIAMTKVWDQRLAKKLKEKFEKMWKTAKKFH
ncbi:MAG: TrmB family transcriptional regulator [Thermoplasmata archaeon]|nr:TrmB family transcriptional regulator [Thermoplasmata archaeon]